MRGVRIMVSFLQRPFRKACSCLTTIWPPGPNGPNGYPHLRTQDIELQTAGEILRPLVKNFVYAFPCLRTEYPTYADAVRQIFLLEFDAKLATRRLGETVEAFRVCLIAFIDLVREYATRYQKSHGDVLTPKMVSPWTRDMVVAKADKFSALEGQTRRLITFLEDQKRYFTLVDSLREGLHDLIIWLRCIELSAIKRKETAFEMAAYATQYEPRVVRCYAGRSP